MFTLQRKFLLIDFNPFGEVTDPLLFNWTDLNQLDVTSPESQSWVRKNVKIDQKNVLQKVSK